MPAVTQRYTFGQLEQLWINAGGSRSKAPIMAAIALAESGGDPTATNKNSNGTVDRGLWQINSVHGSQSTYDIAGNAKAAVSIEKYQGFSGWTTYTTGAYRKFLSSASPDPNLPSGSTSTAVPGNATQTGLSGDIGGAIGQGLATGFSALLEPMISTFLWGGEILFGIALMVIAVIVFVMATKTGRSIGMGAVKTVGMIAAPETAIARIPRPVRPKRS